MDPNEIDAFHEINKPTNPVTIPDSKTSTNQKVSEDVLAFQQKSKHPFLNLSQYESKVVNYIQNNLLLNHPHEVDFKIIANLKPLVSEAQIKVIELGAEKYRLNQEGSINEPIPSQETPHLFCNINFLGQTEEIQHKIADAVRTLEA